MLVAAESLSLHTVLSLEGQGYKVEMHADEEYAKITKEDKDKS